MNISWNWLRDFIVSDLNLDEVSELLTSIGLEVEAVEKIESVKGGLEGIVIGEVISRDKHPDADRLSITQVNVGSEILQIVCGASNVAAGQKVVVALNGATLYPSTGDPFKIKKSKIRGVESNGMICAEDEIGLGESHEGIMVLDPAAKTGSPASEYFNIEADHCISIGLTPNRIDAASHYGVARDLYAAIAFSGRNALLKTIDHGKITSSDNEPFISVEIQNTENCKRYSGITISGVKVESSPSWIQNRLRAIGLRPVNNIVDITNYVMHECGHPLHAFDAEKINGKKIIVKNAKQGSSFTTLDGVQHELSSSDLMICDVEKELCIAGVFGGLNSGVTELTTSVFLESAWFNPVAVRKTARRHGLSTDSSFRFERGADPQMVIPAIQKAASLIMEIAGGKIESSLIDIFPGKFSNSEIKIQTERVRKMIGKNISDEEILKILTLLEIKITDSSHGQLTLSVPTYRVDVTREADVVEEILRIYGYNNIELPGRISASLNNSPAIDADVVQSEITALLSSRGFVEILCNSIINGEFVERNESSNLKAEWNVPILNPLSQELDVMRQTMMAGGLQSLAYNINRQNSDLKFFEFGKIYRKKDNSYEEMSMLSILMCGRKLPESWNSLSDEVSFFSLKSAVHAILQRFGLEQSFRFQPIENGLLEDGLRYEIAGKTIVEFGWIKSAVLKYADIKQQVYYAEFYFDNLLSVPSLNKVKYREISRFPAVRRDLSLLLDKKVNFSEIESAARSAEKKLLKQIGLFDVYEGKNLEEGKKSYAVSFLLQDEEQTLTDQVIEKAMERILSSLKEKTGAQLR